MKKGVLSLLTALVVVSCILISSCIPVKLVNRNLDSTYVYLKFSPEETHEAIKKGTIKGAIYIDDALLPPRHTKMEGKISRCIIIPHGKHKLMIDAEGFKPWQKELFFSGSWLKLKIELEQK